MAVLRLIGAPAGAARSAAGPAARRGGRRRPGTAAGRRRRALGDEHLAAVLELRREVHRGQVGAPARPARAAQRVVDARARGQPVHARPPHGARDVHGHAAAAGALDAHRGAVPSGAPPACAPSVPAPASARGGAGAGACATR